MAADYTKESTYSISLRGTAGELLSGYSGVFKDLAGMETGTAITAHPTVSERFAGLHMFNLDWSTITSTTYPGINSGTSVVLGEDIGGVVEFGKRSAGSLTLKTATVANLASDTVNIISPNDTDNTTSTTKTYKFYNAATPATGAVTVNYGTASFTVGGTEAFSSAVKASATFTFGATEFDDVNNGTLTLIDNAGLSKTYIIRNDYGASGALEFNAGGSAAVAAANFKALVEGSNGHDGTIVVTDGGSGVITIEQATPGTGGNTTITPAANWNNTTSVNVGAAFAGGFDPTITLIDSASLSKTYKVKYDYTAVAGSQEINAGANATVLADNFKQLVESADGHNGTITVVVTDPGGSDAAVTLTQATSGTVGNKSIATSNWDAITSVNVGAAFAGGAVDDTAVNIYGLTTLETIAAQIEAAIEHANGHAGKVIATVGAVAGSEIPITLSQFYHGPGGDTTVTSSDSANLTAVSFTGGETLEDSLRYIVLHLSRTDIASATISTDVTKLIQVELGKWEIKTNQLIFYESDGTTVLKTFNLFDKNDQATSIAPYKRVPI